MPQSLQNVVPVVACHPPYNSPPLSAVSCFIPGTLWHAKRLHCSLDSTRLDLGLPRPSALLSLMLMAVEVCLELCVRVATMLQVYKTNAKLVATCAASFCFFSYHLFRFNELPAAALALLSCETGINNSSQQLPRFISCSSLCSCFICCSSFSFYFLNCSHNKQLLTQKQRRMKEITYSSQNVI